MFLGLFVAFLLYMYNVSFFFHSWGNLPSFVHVNIHTSQNKNRDCKRLLGIDIDCKLSFENHISQICSSTRAKIKTVGSIAPYLNKGKRKLLMNAFFKSQFSICPLSWMSHSHALNNKINRFLRTIHNNNTSSFTDLFGIDNSVFLHYRNIQVLSTKLYKFVNGLSLKLHSDCFNLNDIWLCVTVETGPFLFLTSVHCLTWHRVTLPLGTENLGNFAKLYEKLFNTHSLQKSHYTMEATWLFMSPL